MCRVGDVARHGDDADPGDRRLQRGSVAAVGDDVPTAPGERSDEGETEAS